MQHIDALEASIYNSGSSKSALRGADQGGPERSQAVLGVSDVAPPDGWYLR
jgi:hypothetical protein